MSEFKFPTEVIELPSKGLIYPKDNPLSSGKIEMKYMTAKEEDILTNQNYIQKGIVIDKLLQSLIVSKINYNDLVVGDKNAIMVAARVLGYGKDYEFTYKGETHKVDLSSLEAKSFNESLFESGKNEFEFITPTTNTKITFKLLTHGDEQTINQEIEGLKKINPKENYEFSTRLKTMILSVEGNYDKKAVREFVDNYFLARDSRAFREYIREMQPDINIKFKYEDSNGLEEEVDIPITLNFFWPDAGV